MKTYRAYKDSDIEWIGDIPKHWGISQLKYQTNFNNGAAFKPSDWKDSGIPIIRIVNLNGGDEFNYYLGEVDEKYHVVKGDLLFSWSGNIGTSFGPVGTAIGGAVGFVGGLAVTTFTEGIIIYGKSPKDWTKYGVKKGIDTAVDATISVGNFLWNLF